MTEYPELFEKIDRLDREMDVQAALIEGLTDRVSGLVEVVLELERTRGVRRAKPKNQKGSSTPSLPGMKNENCEARSERPQEYGTG